MNISALFIKRPVATTLIQLAIVIFGIIGYLALPVSDLPSRRLPDHLGQCHLCRARIRKRWPPRWRRRSKSSSRPSAGVTSISSTNGLGSTIDHAAVRSRSRHRRRRAGRAGGHRAHRPPAAAGHAGAAVAAEGQSGRLADPVPDAELADAAALDVNEYAEINVAQRISMLPGVAQVSIFGAQKFAVRIDVDPRQLAARNLDIEQVATRDRPRQREPADRHALRTATGRLPSRPTGSSTNAMAFGPLVVAYRDGRPVRLDEVANVYDGVENDKRRAGSTTRARSIWPSTASRAPTRSRSSIRSARCCRRSSAAARRADARHPQRPVAVDSRVGARHQAHAGRSRSCWSCW